MIIQYILGTIAAIFIYDLVKQLTQALVLHLITKRVIKNARDQLNMIVIQQSRASNINKGDDSEDFIPPKPIKKAGSGNPPSIH